MVLGSSQLTQTLNAALFEDVHSFWFSHLDSDASRILPGQRDLQRWFQRNGDFDQACITKFQLALETVVASRASAVDILNIVNPSSPFTWLSLIIFLDQIPRNCYRGGQSRLVFSYFDTIAEAITLRAIGVGIPTQSLHIRYRLAYRLWFLLPLMHSENLVIHEQAVQYYTETTRDIEEFLSRDISSLVEEERSYYQVFSNQLQATQAFFNWILDLEIRHKVIIEQFGRYPHRNQALARESTPEEILYLANGGETFG